MILDHLIQAVPAVVQPDLLLLLAGAVLLGIIAGALPGISSTMGVAVIAPLTFTLQPFPGIISLLGLYCGSVYGGSISAILLGIPGTPGAVATTLDGYTMGRKGQAGRALGISTISSFVGGMVSCLALALLSYPIANFALAFGPREYLAVAVFALTAVANLSGGSFLMGALSALIGMFLASIGIDETFGVSRFHFGTSYLMGGISFIPAIIGLFAVPETLANIETISRINRLTLQVSKVLPGWRTLLALLPAQLRSGVIGTIVGAVPGTGSDVAAIVAYSQGKNFSRHPERFGTGYEEGIACPESGNNAATGGTMIPLLTLGIPGGAVTAIVLGTFMVHGLHPGPLLLRNNAELVYQIFVGLFIANIFMLVFGLLGARLFAKVLRIPTSILSPLILLLCVLGAFSMRNSLADIYTMLGIGLVGFVMLKIGIPRAPLVIGLILGPLVESELARSLVLIRVSWMEFFTPISTAVWILAALPFVWPHLRRAVTRLFGI